jgi:hypothetical protein
MFGATTTIGSMEKDLTLRDVIDNINRIAAVLTERINKIDVKFDSRFDMLEKRVGSLGYQVRGIKVDTQELKERTARIELTTYHTQKDADAFHGEMRGIHKVIDRFNGRVMRLETHAGFPGEDNEE